MGYVQLLRFLRFIRYVALLYAIMLCSSLFVWPFLYVFMLPLWRNKRQKLPTQPAG